MSDNQPQVGTCGISMIAHHDTARPHERKSGCVDWTPLPQPTPAQIEIGTCEVHTGEHAYFRLPGPQSPACKNWKAQPTPAEPPDRDGAGRTSAAQNDWNKLLLEIARLYALIDVEWADADIVEMNEFDPWYALRELPKRMVGSQPEPDERAAQAEAVNKIWNQFRSGDGEEDCELYRALEQAYGAGRARAGSSLIAEPEKRAAFMHKVPANRRLVVLEAWDDGFKAGRLHGASQDSEESFVLELAAIYGLDENFMRALPVATLDMWKMLVRKNAEQHKSERETMEMFRKELCDLKFGASPPSSPGAAQTPLIHWSMIGPPDEPAGACWEGDCYPDEPQKISTDIREVTCIECHKHYLTLNDLKRALSSGAQSRADDNLNSAVRQYRHAVHGMDCTCKDCTRLLKILVSDNYELSSPGAAQNVQLLEIIPCAVCGQGQHVGYGHMYVPSEVDK